MVFDSLLNPVLFPLLKLPALWALIIMALIVSVIITYVHKWMTDQTLMKSLKMKQKEFQKKMKEHKDNPQKMLSMQKEMMSVNKEYMKHSLKPTFITFLPIIIIFGWMSANLAFEPLMPDEMFTTTIMFEEGRTGTVELFVPEGVTVLGDSTKELVSGAAVFDLKGDEGDYLLQFDYGEMSFTKELTISTEQRYAEVVKNFDNGVVKTVSLNNKKLVPLPISENHLGWLGTYIVFSIVFSMGLRKILGLH